MLTLPSEIITLLMPFALLFSSSVFSQARLLLVGAILTPGSRTVAAALRAMGLSHLRQFENYHRVLNRAAWSPRQAALILLRLLVGALALSGPLVLGLDDTLERRRGEKIAAKGIYHDPVRCTRSHFVKSSGLRWLSLMVLTPIPWAKRMWALPFFTILAPSLRFQQKQTPQRSAPKKLTDWARQMVWQVRRWLPKREIVVVADSSFAALELLDAWAHPGLHAPITAVTPLRLDAGLYQPASPRRPGQNGRPRKKGERLPTLEGRLVDRKTQWQSVQISQWYGRTKKSAKSVKPHLLEIATGTAVWYHSGMPPVPLRWVLIRDPLGELKPMALLCTNRQATPQQVISWYACRWCVEVTFQEVRAHLGMKTQRQWNDRAIARTTPCLLALFSLVTLWAHQRVQKQPLHQRLTVRQAAWYVKEQPTFGDALAWVRHSIWSHAQRPFSMSCVQPDREKIQYALLTRMTDLLCYAARWIKSSLESIRKVKTAE
jgi:hypothetical protein